MPDVTRGHITFNEHPIQPTHLKWMTFSTTNPHEHLGLGEVQPEYERECLSLCAAAYCIILHEIVLYYCSSGNAQLKHQLRFFGDPFWTHFNISYFIGSMLFQDAETSHGLHPQPLRAEGPGPPGPPAAPRGPPFGDVSMGCPHRSAMVEELLGQLGTVVVAEAHRTEVQACGPAVVGAFAGKM